MFQSFEARTDPSQGAARVAALRARMAEHGVDGFLVPRADEHQGEYVAERSERLRWLTGFTGSAGAALVLNDRALLFVDGRYALQAREQADPAIFEIESLVETPPARWLRENAEAGARIGFDPWLTTIAEAKSLRLALARHGAELVAVEVNLVDRCWHDQPPPPQEKIAIHPHEFAGELAKDKIARLSEKIASDGASHAVLSDPASLAWLFNIRGRDVPHTPLALGFALLKAAGRPLLFLSPDKMDIEAEAYLTQLADLKTSEELEHALKTAAAEGNKVALDPALSAEKLRLVVEAAGGSVAELPDPARLPRAVKNAAELRGTRSAHLRDGAAMARFLAWLDRQQPGSVDEIAAAQALEGFRASTAEKAQMPLRDISFDTISGAGPNGAVIHYRVTTRTNRKLGKGELYLVDSGGQYQDGTTDITRTIAIGEPTEEMRERYTLVLKGLIAISMLRFPAGTRGCDIDAFARLALWRRGLDFAHGTGHGVGSYLAVHEGPQRIAKTGTQKLLPGMIVSNEPGYYKPGAYGIRLENLIVVTEAGPVEGGDMQVHGFETLTLVPFDRRLIQPDLLSGEELAWLDAYHAAVARQIGPLLEAETRGWIEAATAPLSH